MEYQPYSIRQLLESVSSGGIRIPAFQRGFVWEMDKVAYLMDSIYKRYPFGSLLFWRTKSKLAIEKKLGQFQLPEPREDYPIDYVLDGQQRLTSIFSVFQTELKPTGNGAWLKIYFALEADENAQESQFIALQDTQVIYQRHFPLNVLFESVRYREATDKFNDEQIKRLDKLQEKFKEVSIPVQILKTDNRATVAIVFERINRLGVALDTLQLLSAWTWNEEFDLLQRFTELKDDLEEFGFSEVGEDSDLILRCAAAILKEEPTPDKLLELNGEQVRAAFPKVRNGILGAIDFLRKQLKIASLKNLPYSALIVPLAVFFAEPDGREVSYDSKVNDRLKKWFWRSCFTGRYSSQTRKTTIDDIKEVFKLKNGEISLLGEFSCDVNEDFFISNQFSSRNANTKTYILLLANNNPKSFVSGALIDIDKVLQNYNKTQFHHVYPKAYLKDKGWDEASINCLANFCFLSGSENKKIGRKKPSEYIDLMPKGSLLDEILRNAFCPQDTFNDNFQNFLSQRSKMLAAFAKKLIQN
ncbi:DUF262 domain-containing protein [Microseira wollei]|uniref:GmrSD restriction endonucleases N-terminal domain-containing protein n=1 Tax=Microseira wollei NIES-4236 TaxID=2530354 RepID=A0AAV3XL27_9CYAN|nr:DUF262 domain-containing protein [Microseira wollei]GET42635.1 hypothetical protein MiSe_74530 [Microseira wollei NIES-4236]